MKFNFPFHFRKKRKTDIYLGILLAEHEGVVFYIKPEGKKMNVVEEERFSYTNGWENLTDDIDEVLYRLEEKRKEKSPDEAIFFLHSQFVDSKLGEIKKPYFNKIKEMVKKLDMKALGYIECREAIIEYLKEKEKVPTTGIIIELDPSSFSVFTYIGGKLIFSDHISRTQDFIEDIRPIFARANNLSVLPSRIFIFEEKYLDSRASKLFDHRWSEQEFPQQPKLEIVSNKQLIYALLSVFAEQISVTTIGKEQKKEEKIQEVMGFVVGRDAPEKQASEISKARQLPKAHLTFNPALILKPPLVFAGLAKSIFKGIVGFFRSQNKPSGYLFISVFGLVLVGFGLFSTEYFFHKAEVSIIFPAQSIKKRLNVIASQNSGGGTTLPLITATESAILKENVKTTGLKNIGEKSKGSITIYNSSLSEGKTFSKGVKLSTPNELEFVLDSDIKIASASGDASAIASSTAKAQITAENIGSEYNVGAGTKFSIVGEQPAVVIAKNDSAFVGGSKRQILTVSKEDLEKLRSEVVKKAKKQSEQGTKNKTQDSKPIQQLTKAHIVKEVFSNETGEEADTVNIQATVATSEFLYKEEDLYLIVSKLLKDEIKQNMKISKDHMKYNIKDVNTQEERGYKLILDLDAKAVQEINNSKILAKLKGKSIKAMTDILKDDFNAAGVEYDIKHPISPFKGILPIFDKNINLKIIYQ